MATPSGTTLPERPPEYVLGTDEQESDRLGLQHRLWSAAAHELWERAALRPGATVLDVGCGPGHATMDLAEVVGSSGSVYAVDESASFLKHLHDRVVGRHRTNVHRVLGDASEMPELMPDQIGTIDLAYARWVLCFVPDPQAVVSAVARMLRPGGRFAVQDYFSYESMTLAPRDPAFSRGIAAIGRSWRDRGGDPDIVSRLPAMMREAGLEVVDLRPHLRVARPGHSLWAWPDSFWQSFIPRLARMGYLTNTEAEEFFEAWRRASTDPDRFQMLPPVWDVLAVKR